MGMKELLKLDYLILWQFIGFLAFFFLSNNSFKSVILYFSFMIFFCYWLIKICFSKEVIMPKKIISNKKV